VIQRAPRVERGELGATSSPPDHSLATRLAWITGLRLGFLTLLLGATTTLYLRGELARYPFSLHVVFVTIATGFALAAVYAGALRMGRRLQALAWAQIALDQVTWTAIVYVTGGATSGATSFYALTCLLGAILVGLRGAAVAAGLGIAIYATLCAGLHFGWVQPPLDQAEGAYALAPSQIIYPLLINALGMTVVALLGGYLAERLRLTGGALQVATQRANEAERLAVLGRIAAGLAHEIRNPLGSITGSIEMLRESTALSDEDRRLCDIVQREARRLNDLVGDMVDLSKPRRPRPEAIDISGLAREVVALASNAARGGDVRVAYEGPEQETLVRCDGAQMRQVVWNLVRNAIQASSAGSTVTVRVEPRERDVTLAVDDQGQGIPETVALRIFDEFFTTRTHGAGIGLAVVRRILQDHAPMGARLAVQRGPSGGASFQVTLNRDVVGLRKSYRPPRPSVS
jgi:two-component system, NtrC family, sensor histidine kinase HydH